MARTYGKDIMEAALRNHSNVLLTIHGAPLTYSTKTQDENIKGIVPENCILIIITPPQAVVFSSPVEDTETYRFFQQNEANISKFSIDTNNFYLYAHDGTVYEFSAPKSKIEHFKSAINFQILT